MESHKVQRVCLFVWTEATLGINNRVNETLGMNFELKIRSRVTSLIIDCAVLVWWKLYDFESFLFIYLFFAFYNLLKTLKESN
jgi:hypothetical protein